MTIPRAVIVPFVPSADLLPNARRRNHWSATARATQDARLAATSAATEYWTEPPWTGPLTVSVLVVWPRGRRSCDADALAGLCKPIIDGLAGRCFLDDSQIKRITYESQRLSAPTEAHWPDGCVSIVIADYRA